MVAVIDGEVEEGLFSSEDAPPIAPPVVGFPTSGSYQCSDAQLDLQYSMLSSSVTEMWTRAEETP